MVTWLPLPMGTLTRFALVSPATQLRLETVAGAAPAGVTFRKLAVVVLVTVTLRTTPVAPAGAATVRLRDPPGPSGADAPPVPFRVSRIRMGFCAVYATG